MFDCDSARKAAVEHETQMKGDLEFSLSILVLGKTGVGKSATINSIFGEKKAVIDAFEPATTCVEEIIDVIDGFKVKVFDTPGLRTSPTDESFNRKVLSSIKNLMQKSPPDVVLYVDRLDTQIGNINDLPLLRLVVSYLGSSIWRRSIVVLTHATSIPPDGPDGYPLSYEVFVAQKSRIVQQLISLSSGELLMNLSLMIPVSLVENHPFAKTNEHGELNGENWRLQLLFLCYSIKTLSKVSSLVTVQSPSNHRSLFGLKICSPALSYFLSSLLQPKGVDSDVELGYLSDSDEEGDIECDNLPLFRSLTKTEIANLSNDQQKAYFHEYDYRVKLLQKKQSREEIRRFKDSRNAKNAAPDETYMEGVPDQETISVPLPDMPLPPSFDGENPSYRYHFLETSSHLLARPVFDTHGWDHDCGYDGVLIEGKSDISSRFPAVISVQLTKDKKDFHIQLHSSIFSKHGDSGLTTAGLDVQTLGDKLTYTLKGKTKIKNFRNNKTAAGVSIAFVDKTTIYGLKIEDHLAVGKQLILMGNAGVVQSQDDAAYGVNLDLCTRDEDYPINQRETSVGLSIMRYRGDLICGCNLQSQFSVGRSSQVHVRAGLNNKLSGQICIKTSCSDQLQIAALAFLPIAKAIFKKIFHHSTQEDYSR
ncbi:Small monomeric GTPase [Handroanthus impetiginosus]|uniref:Small monomeric GTPase n=1 Tax=Handroanthus impetiginosus TaxID=429701 RepID=A0A2G9GHR8_9LAMI|nr:Small monomeric GTPase [Handroanthus impetiginosus]